MKETTTTKTEIIICQAEFLEKLKLKNDLQIKNVCFAEGVVKVTFNDKTVTDIRK